MAMTESKPVKTSEFLHKGYDMVESAFGGFYFQVGDEASEDFPTRRQAALAARDHWRQHQQQRNDDAA